MRSANPKNRNTKSTPEYAVWKNMIRRCENPKHKSYEIYGGRGIKVCKRWMNSFLAFLGDMGPRPKGFTIERKKNNQGYSPKNCEWVSWKVNQRNRRDNRILKHSGKSQTIAEWSEETGINYQTILSRLRYGWTVSRTLTYPVQPRWQGWRNKSDKS